MSDFPVLTQKYKSILDSRAAFFEQKKVFDVLFLQWQELVARSRQSSSVSSVAIDELAERKRIEWSRLADLHHGWLFAVNTFLDELSGLLPPETKTIEQIKL